MYWSQSLRCLVLARLAGAAMILCASLSAGILSAQQTMENPSADESGSPSVFGPASAEQRARIAHPGLRVELLRMAAEDQAARSAAT